MIKHLYRTSNPLYIKWSLRHRPLTVQLVLRLFQNPAPLISLLCVRAFTVHMGTVTLWTLLIFFHHLLAMVWYASSNNMGLELPRPQKKGILHA